jgi:hypothetical protein
MFLPPRGAPAPDHAGRYFLMTFIVWPAVIISVILGLIVGAAALLRSAGVG